MKPGVGFVISALVTVLAAIVGAAIVGAAELSPHPQRTAEAARQAQARHDQLATLPQPEEDHDLKPGKVWGRPAAWQPQAVRQLSRPLVRPSERLAELEAGS